MNSFSCREPTENYMFIFLSKEIKSSWEAYFLDAKQQLGRLRQSKMVLGHRYNILNLATGRN
jgi:hypothetical protein